MIPWWYQKQIFDVSEPKEEKPLGMDDYCNFCGDDAEAMAVTNMAKTICEDCGDQYGLCGVCLAVRVDGVVHDTRGCLKTRDPRWENTQASIKPYDGSVFNRDDKLDFYEFRIEVRFKKQRVLSRHIVNKNELADTYKQVLDAMVERLDAEFKE